MTDEKRKKLDRISRVTAVIRAAVKNGISIPSDELTIADFEWLQSELKAAWNDIVSYRKVIHEKNETKY